MPNNQVLHSLMQEARRLHGEAKYNASNAKCDEIIRIAADHANNTEEYDEIWAHNWCADAACQKAFNLYHAGRYAEALKVLVQAGEYAGTLYAEQSPSELKRMEVHQHPALTRARIAWMEGECETKLQHYYLAEKRYCEAFRIAKPYADQPEFKSFIELLDSAVVRHYIAARQPQKAVKLGEQILKDRQPKKGEPADIRLPTSIMNLAEAYIAAGHPKKAEVLAKEALIARE